MLFGFTYAQISFCCDSVMTDRFGFLIVIIPSSIPQVSPPEEKKPSAPTPKPSPPPPPAAAPKVAPPAGSLFSLFFSHLCWLIKSQPCFCLICAVLVVSRLKAFI